MGLVYSQKALSIQLPIPVFTLIYLTSKKSVKGTYDNSTFEKISLWIVGLIVAFLYVLLFASFFA